MNAAVLDGPTTSGPVTGDGAIWRLTLGQMKASRSRLIAAAIAIAIGTAFAAATLSTNVVLAAGTRDSITAQFGRADLVAKSPEGISEAQIAQIAKVDGVSAAASMRVTTAFPSSGSMTGMPIVTSTPTRSLQSYAVQSGSLPTRDDQIALPASYAERHHIAAGGRVEFQNGDAPVGYEVTGTVSNREGAWRAEGDIGVMTADGQARLEGSPVGQSHDATALIAASGNTSAVTDEVGSLLGAGAQVTTREDAAQAAMDQQTGGEGIFTAFLLTFAALALIVAGLVIANTFAVLVAQRTRTLAMLRCIGASRRQVRRTVLLEGLLLGLLASAVGVLGGFAFAQGALTVMRHLVDDVPLPTLVPITWPAVVVPILAGTLVTVVSAFVPAREASRVAPLAALRPVGASGRGTVRVAGVRRYGSLLAVVLGAAAMALGWAVAVPVGASVLAGLALAVLGGALSFAGIAWGAVLWIPPASRALSALTRRSGPSARLAAANAVRNPRRMAATSTALLIGVTLVSMMSVGAASARASLGAFLSNTYPVDAVVTLWNDNDAPVAPATVTQAQREAAEADGVSAVVPAKRLDSSWIMGTKTPVEAFALEPADAARVIDAKTVRTFAPDDFVVSEAAARIAGLKSGGKVSISASGYAQVTRTVVVVPGGFDKALTGPVPTRALGDAGQRVLLAKFAGHADPAATRDGLSDAITVPHAVDAPAAERAQFESVIDTMLAFVLGLLAVAVVIALIGVTNTLSLSVLERRRESATLRAIGMSGRQLRRMLVVEGVFLALVGAVFGIALGTVYGWVGSLTVLSSFAGTSLALPWRTFGAILLIAVTAGLLASLLPARTAVKDSPVEALAVE